MHAAGWLAGRMRKDSILRMLGFVQLAAIATTAHALVQDDWDPDHKFRVLCLALALWGTAQGNSPVLDSLFADSVPTGSRASMYSWLYISYILSQGLGPATAAAVFHYTGDTWDLQIMQQVMLLGMAIALVPTAILFFFNDDKTLGAESDSLRRIIQEQKRRRILEQREQQGLESLGGLRKPLLGEGQPHAAGLKGSIENELVLAVLS